MYLYKRGLISVDEWLTLATFVGGVGSIVAMAVLMRAFGRILNPKYVSFVEALRHTETNSYINNIRKYDFEFSSWPTTFSVPPRFK